MRSRLFSKNDLTGLDDFTKDAKILLSLPVPVISKIASYVYNVFQAESPSEKDVVVEKASAALKVSPANLNHVFSLSLFFIREFAITGDAAADDPNDIVLDLSEIVDTPKDSIEALRQFIHDLKQISQEQASTVLLQRKYASLGLPTLETATTLVDFRMVFDKNYEVVDANPDTFPTKCMGTIPMGIIRLGFNDGHVKETFFQADERTITILINSLRALKRQIDLAKTHLGLVDNADNQIKDS